MPKSKKRHHSHHSQQQHDTTAHKPAISKNNRVIKGGIILFSILGLLASYFMAGPDIGWLITGTAIGGVSGYFFGRQMDKTFSK